jgi:hypothetical protein
VQFGPTSLVELLKQKGVEASFTTKKKGIGI